MSLIDIAAIAIGVVVFLFVYTVAMAMCRAAGLADDRVMDDDSKDSKKPPR